MRILIAEDDAVCRKVLVHQLLRWGHEPVTAKDGVEALSMLRRPDSPLLAILDWMMPGVNGPEICTEIHRSRVHTPRHLILLTSKTDPEHIVAGLQAGADDYIAKPFHPEELRARVDVGIRIILLQQRLIQRIEDFEAADAELDHLQGLLPICSYCSSIRNERDRWERVDSYFHKYSGINFTHGVCPDCQDNLEPALRRKCG